MGYIANCTCISVQFNKTTNDKSDHHGQMILFRRTVMTYVSFAPVGRIQTDDPDHPVHDNQHPPPLSRRFQGVVKHHWWMTLLLSPG